MREIVYRVQHPREIKLYRTRNGAAQKVTANQRKPVTVHVGVVEWREVPWPIPEDVMDEMYERMEQ